MPVVIVLHPIYKDAAWAEKTMGWDEYADKYNFIVVYGQSNAAQNVWNAGLTPAEIQTGQDDDDYIKGVIKEVESNYPIDRTRVYLLGMSGGAFMTAKIGSEIPDSLTAIATVEGLTGFAGNDILVPKSPLSAVMIRGTADQWVPYTDTEISALFKQPVCSAIQSATDWAQADGCSSTPSPSKLDGGHIDISDYTGGTNGTKVELVTVNGGKHVYAPEDTDIIWKFFKGITKQTDTP